MGLLISWWKLSTAEKLLIVQMTILLVLIRLGLRVFNLNSLRKRLDWIASRFSGSPQQGDLYLDQVVWAATTVGRRVLDDGPCLAQALAVQFLLKRRRLPAELCIGVTKDTSGKLVAHAWVETNGQVVIGGSQEDLDQYSRLPELDRKLA